MKKTILSLFSLLLCAFMFAQSSPGTPENSGDKYLQEFDNSNKSYNLEKYNEKEFYKQKQTVKPKSFGGYVQMHLGIGPTHVPKAFAGVSMGITQRFAEISVLALPSITAKDFHVFAGMVGLKAPVNKIFDVTLRLGYWAYANEDFYIKWKGGNHFIYGADLSKRIESNLELVGTWLDCRGQGQYDGTKIGTLGVRYLF